MKPKSTVKPNPCACSLPMPVVYQPTQTNDSWEDNIRVLDYAINRAREALDRIKARKEEPK